MPHTSLASEAIWVAIHGAERAAPWHECMWIEMRLHAMSLAATRAQADLTRVLIEHALRRAAAA